MKRKFIFILLAIFAAGTVILMNRRVSPVIQPISFNHEKHISEAGLECGDCHELFKTLPAAGFPAREKCEECHSEPLTENPEENKIQDYISENREIEWKRITELPGHVYFSHRRHITLGEIGCQECHGDMSVRTSPPENPVVKMSMDRCMKCHEERRINNDCLACHV